MTHYGSLLRTIRTHGVQKCSKSLSCGVSTYFHWSVDTQWENSGKQSQQTFLNFTTKFQLTCSFRSANFSHWVITSGNMRWLSFSYILSIPLAKEWTCVDIGPTCRLWASFKLKYFSEYQNFESNVADTPLQRGFASWYWFKWGLWVRSVCRFTDALHDLPVPPRAITK